MGFRRDGVATPSTYPAGDGSGNGLSRPPSQHEQLAVGLASLHPPASMTPATDEHLATGLVLSVPGPRCPTPRNVPDPTLRLRLLRAIRASASSAQANNGRQRGDFVLTTARACTAGGALESRSSRGSSQQAPDPFPSRLGPCRLARHLRGSVLRSDLIPWLPPGGLRGPQRPRTDFGGSHRACRFPCGLPLESAAPGQLALGLGMKATAGCSPLKVTWSCSARPAGGRDTSV